MKNVKIVFIVFFAVNILFACKTKDKTPAPTIVGFWKGLYGYGTATPDIPYAFLFRQNSTVRTFARNTDTALAQKAEGTYSVTGTSVQTTYMYLPALDDQSSTTGTATENFSSMTGTWGSGTSRTDGGTFNLTKQ